MFKVTVEIEGNEYVARTNDGDWHTRGKIQEQELTGMELAEYLYHSDEIAFTEQDENERTVIYILDGTEANISESFSMARDSISGSIESLNLMLDNIDRKEGQNKKWTIQDVSKLLRIAELLYKSTELVE